MNSTEDKFKQILKEKGYQIQKILGRGSFGIVYQILSDSDKKIYALKKILEESAPQEEIESFKNEIEVLKFLDCPFIMKHIKTIEQPELLLVTEFIDGYNFDEIIGKKKINNQTFTDDEIIRYITQICIGLNHIHKHNVMHRDLSPKNIMLTHDNFIKICDFGFSKKLDASNTTASIVGTPFYCAPELLSLDEEYMDDENNNEEIKKENQGYTNKIDMWALGVIIYQFITLTRPFLTIPNILNIQYRPLKKTVRKEFRELIANLFDKCPEKRYSAEDILGKIILL